ncbi:hypothetical protein Tco_0050479, partial [Tanacetum coccineum]
SAVAKLVDLIEAHDHLNLIFIPKYDGSWKVNYGEVVLELKTSTDISKITRKQSKTGKHRHWNQKSTREAKDSKPKKEKVKSQSKKVKPWSNKVNSQKDKNPKYHFSPSRFPKVTQIALEVLMGLKP